MKLFNYVSVALVAAVLVGCDGDARPFEEAVEVRTENLVSIELVPPTITVDELIMNFGETVQFGVQGTNVMGQTVPLEGTDRDWRVTEESFASINEDGLLVAKANGDVGVSISIGGLDSDTYNLRVFDAPLSSVDTIIGEPTIERCLPQDYQAVGTYGSDQRDLIGVGWTLAAADADNARVLNNPGLSATVTGLNTGSITLTATLDDLSLSKPIVVSDSLMALSISPRGPISIEVDDEERVAAFAEFSGAAPGSTSDEESRSGVNVTESVDWQILSSGSSYVSVSNDIDSRGQLTGLSAGTATLRASCGNVSAEVEVIVSGSSSSTDELSFQKGDSMTLAITAAAETLRVSTGTVFSSANELDQSDLTWELSVDDSANPAISLQTTGINAGRIAPLNVNQGATVTVTDSDGATGSIRVEVTSN